MDGGVEILEEDEPGEPTEEEVIEYARFLDIDPDTEPQFMWIAREGVAAPVPHPWKACTEDDEVFYFNFETSESIWDHPCDSHYKELLAEARKKHASGSASAPQPSSETLGIAGNSVPAADSDMDNSKSFVSEAVDSEGQSGSSAGGSPAGANNSKASLADDDSKSFVSEAVSDESSPKASPTGASSEQPTLSMSGAKDTKQSVSAEDQAALWKSKSGGDAMSSPRSSRSSRSASSVGSRDPPKRDASRSPESRRSSRSASSDSRRDVADERLEAAPYSPRSSRNSYDDDHLEEALDSPKSSRSSDSIDNNADSSSKENCPPVGCIDKKEEKMESESVIVEDSCSSVDKTDEKMELETVTVQDSSSRVEAHRVGIPSALESAPQASPKSSQASPAGSDRPQRSPQASPQGSDRPQPVLDHGGYSARSSNPSEISEEFNSDWGVLSPPTSARSGRCLTGISSGFDVQNSLEVSASGTVDTEISKSLGLWTGLDKHVERKEIVEKMLRPPAKSWHALEEDVRVLAEALESIKIIRSKQKEYLNIIKVDV